ncbi:MAG: phosphoenolpyruvate--protein phosphotransferase [Pseudomonadota bacterium]
MVGSPTSDVVHRHAICAPSRGWVLPLSEAPDPAFSSGALGKGVAIELLDDLLCAPCAAKVVAIAKARHAITLELPGGAQILVHCGIDTVALNGAPFTIMVEEESQVSVGDPLIRVDLEAVTRAGKSLATPVVLIEPANTRLEIVSGEGLCVAGDPLFTLRSMKASSADARPDEAYSAQCSVVLPNPHGLHARPSAAIASEAARWSGPIAVALEGRSANARSATALMKLGATHGAELTIQSGGVDAEQALAALTSLIENGAGDEINSLQLSQFTETLPAALERKASAPEGSPQGMISGVAAAPGQILGPAYYLQRAKLQLSETSQGKDIELERLRTSLSQLSAHLQSGNDNISAKISAAHRAILNDPVLIDNVEKRVSEGSSAAMAWQAVMSEEAASLRALPDQRLAERADDFADLEQQLLRILIGQKIEVTAPPGSIVIASDLYPSDLQPLAEAGIAGIATMGGGPTSHLAILAAAAGIPMVVALGKPLCQVEEGETTHLNGDTGTLRHGLTTQDQAMLIEEIEQRRAAHKLAGDHADKDTYLASGERIEVFANLGRVADAEEAVTSGAEGCGLLRTEFLFLDRATPPSEDEQVAIYREVIDKFGERPVIIRTLDIGADKPAAYLPLEAEENPALGVRGIRLGLLYPELLKAQIRAILKAAGERACYIMAPMIASVSEVDALRRMLDEIRSELSHAATVKLGAMVETPASALLAPALCKRLDFLSIGTNDLTQYVLAADRMNPEMAVMLDPMNPAILQLINMTAKAGISSNRMLGVCGSAAADHTAAAVLVGLGVGELSANAAQLPELKQHLRSLTLDKCREAARAALASETSVQAREAAMHILTSASKG